MNLAKIKDPDLRAKIKQLLKTQASPTQLPPQAPAPSKTEQEALAALQRLTGPQDWRHGAPTFFLPGGNQYTPDILSMNLCSVVEVKGSYKLGTYGRSRLAFQVAKAMHPDINFIWMEKRKASRGKPAHWRIEL